MGRSDAELLEASRRGEREAFGALVERYQGVVCAVSYSRTGNRALSEDVAQDTFLAAWHQLDQLREPNRVRAWLCGIARNLARKARVRTERETPVEDDVIISQANPFDEVAEVEAERVVQNALQRVPETYRDVLVLYYREHRSVREVARMLDITEAAALQRLSRGRQYLQQGVTQLVERSLRDHAPKSLVVGVLAAIALAPSHASAAATNAKGTSMLKLALVGTVIAAGTTTAIVKPWSHDTKSTSATTQLASAQTPVAPPSLSAWKMPDAKYPNNFPKGPHGADVKILPAPDTVPLADQEQLDKAKVAVGPSKGAANAPVTITVYADAICPFCAQALGTLDQLLDEYKGKVKIVMKQMPVHTAAVMPAEALYAADAQGKFWELHDLFSQHPDALPRDLVDQLAQQAGLDTRAFDQALDAHTFKPAVDADLASAKDLDLQGAPAFVINGRRITGAQPIEVMRSAIDDALARAQ
ncbi:MAG: sigma-70 family RNA polymerase sigma factor [Kofleriaceae bacterium]